MNGLIKQMFTPNFPVDQLAEHKTEDLRREGPAFESKDFCKKIQKMNTCYYLLLLIVAIQLFPNENILMVFCNFVNFIL